MTPEFDAKRLARKLAEATYKVAEDYEEQDVIGEEDFSSQLCGRLKGSLESYDTGTMTWQIKTAESDEGRGWLKARTLSKVSEEPLYGADIIMVIDDSGPGYQVKKCFLAQAKLLEPGKNLRTRDYE